LDEVVSCCLAFWRTSLAAVVRFFAAVTSFWEWSLFHADANCS
jgi:hypothetical protein